MQFREWINEYAGLREAIDDAFAGIRSFVARSLRVEGGVLAVNFPKDYSFFFGGEPVRLAAWNHPEGDVVAEGFEKEHPLGKAGVAFRAIGDTQLAKRMTPKAADEFQRSFKQNLGKMSKGMGLVFEIEVCLRLREQHGMKVTGPVTLAWLYQEKRKVLAEMGAVTGDPKFVQKVLGLVLIHAKEVGDEIYQKAARVLGCAVDYVRFTGGEHYNANFSAHHRTTADLFVGCSKHAPDERSSLGMSLKFTSETLVLVAHLSLMSAYALLGGKDPGTFRDEREQLGNEPRRYRNYVIGELYELLQSTSKDRGKLDRIINSLVSGTEDADGPHSGDRTSDTFVVARNYVRRRGGAEWSPAIRADFDVSDDQDMKLRIKKDAQVTVNRTKWYTTLNVKSGSWSGTTIKFEYNPADDKVYVKMNNLTSTK